ncbi:hypothetical protein QGN23_08960 [Chryseobacterium gotjawalense]|uniref:30S ribosomal protein S16 n=1 Tax=Chryseobacterium gotjawalense TaxID=3042315 RepID=A0ABY8R9E0_9FLAO|nr:DUF2683 family protein [Chryseobacterium sp. wdc7]WHF50567.1 hypothetical protein QGN23_08960 [Chryseobacterium sp. wdc7]
MESLIVHPKNQMELNALKSVMKDMGIKYEKFHTRNHNAAPKFEPKTASDKSAKPVRTFKDKPKNDL